MVRSFADHTDAAPVPHRGVILAVLCLCQFMVLLDVMIVNVSLDAIRSDLGLSTADLAYVVTTYATLLGGFLMLGGRCADYFGRKPMLIAGMTLFALASLTSALAQAGWQLFASRGAQGLGAAFLSTAALSTLTSIFEEGPARNRALGVWGALAGAGSALGVTMGGVLTDGPGWRWVFWLNVPVGFVAVAAVIRVVPAIATERPARLDLPGAVSLTGGLLLIVAGVSRAEMAGWLAPETFAILGGGVALLAVFLAIERRSSSPLVDLRIFRHRLLRGANIVGFLEFGAGAGFFFTTSLLMQQVFRFSPLKTGFAYLPIATAVLAGAQVASRLATRVAPSRIVMLSLPLAATTFALIAAAPGQPTFWLHLLGPFVLFGFFLGAMFVPIQILALGGVPREETGLAAGLINTCQEVGAAIGVAALATVAASRTNRLMPGDGAPSVEALHSGYRYALLANAGLLLVTFVVAAVLFRGRAEPAGHDRRDTAGVADGADPVPMRR